MSNRTDKFAEKAKTPTMVIDREKGIVSDSAEWHFYPKVASEGTNH